MALVEISLAVPKEMNDVRLFLVALVEAIKAKKSLAEISAGSLPGLMSAIEGFDQLDDEAKLAEAYNLYALLVADLARVLLAKVEVPAPELPPAA